MNACSVNSNERQIPKLVENSVEKLIKKHFFELFLHVRIVMRTIKTSSSIGVQCVMNTM